MNFSPNFYELMSQDSFMYEGIAIVPALYSNARNKKDMDKVIAACLVTVGFILLLYCPMCYIAFGD